MEVYQWDQMLQSVQDMARVHKAYYDAAIASGFNPEQAMRLTETVVSAMMTPK